MAKLYFRYGAMNSGKSIEILRVAHNYKERNMRPAILKPSTDTISDNQIHSRIGMHSPAIIIQPDDDIQSKIDNYDCVLVDEAQFLTEKQVDQLMSIVIKGIPVICYGLRTDFMTKSFAGSKRLLEIAHSIEEIKTICPCGKKAIFNARFDTNGKILTNGNSVEIETLDNPKYLSLCADCYNNESHKWD